MSATLQLHWRSDGEAQHHTLGDGDAATIGRDVDVEVFLFDRRVSRSHGRIELQGGKAMLHNISAKANPIKVGTQLLQAGESIALQDGTHLRLGETDITVRLFSMQTGQDDLRSQCDHCQAQVPYDPKGFCPYCGYALASGHTALLIHRGES